jgi:peptidoglycan/LPS O-acetylase OafA/YrhL
VAIGAHFVWIAAYLSKRTPSLQIPFAIISVIAAASISFVIARYSWNYFELPVMTWGRGRFGARKRLRQEAVTAISR